MPTAMNYDALLTARSSFDVIQRHFDGDTESAEQCARHLARTYADPPRWVREFVVVTSWRHPHTRRI